MKKDTFAEPGRKSAKVKVKKTRQEKYLEKRNSLLLSAAKVVGEHGYAGASVTKITEGSDVAQGTFYLYFNSRQELFDQLLPFIANRALAHIREVSAGSMDFYEREERAFRGFFEYLLDHPYYYRVLGEAETMAPRAFEDWFTYITERYVKQLEKAAGAGEIKGLTRRELRFMGVVLLACRRYVYQQFVKSPEGARPLPKWVVTAYMKMLRRSFGALAGAPHDV